MRFRVRVPVLVLTVALLASACNSGRAGVVARASSEFDQYTDAATPAEWQWMRENYSRLVVWSPYWDERLAEFDDVLVYMNSYGIFADDDLADQHPDWFMREADGTLTYIDFNCGQPGGCPLLAGDLGNPDFVQYQIDRIAQFVAKGYPGIMLDDVNMLRRWSDVDGTDVNPIDPRTGQSITTWNWRRYMADYLTLIRTTFPDIEIMHNSIWYSDSPGFDNLHVTRQIAAADYLMLERGANDVGLVAGTNKFGFQTFLSFIDRAHALGTDVLLMDEDGTTGDRPHDQTYNLAATLLVNAGADLVGSESLAVTAPDSFWPGFSTDLGPATGPREATGGFIIREFENGMVVLREPRLGLATYTLPEPMLDADGKTVSSVTLDGATAAILNAR
ncbi:MAG: putative glycoside hydrolase [Acidimicrobiales bacterium]